jgi:hypothetical protein
MSLCSIVDTLAVVNRTAYMDFREATESLCAGVSHHELANALGVSVATVRQARLQSNAKGHRAPPRDWEHAVIRLAEKQVFHYRQLIDRVRDHLTNGR